MIYTFEIMTQEQAEEIAFKWHYDGEYSFYDMEADREDLEEFIDRKSRGNSVYSVMINKELIGFYSFHKVNEVTYEIGLGMRPDLTGKGEGLNFLKSGLEFAKSKLKPEKLTLSVANFNERAIKVYQKVGFKKTNIFMQPTNGSTFEFVKMEYEC
ncbi:GNAT family N-acetyltransferase [Caldibacillus lycopersici]|uniref:GNAT family N-acetyltransferase n=1 Tax=Perspicuibacillus lycopersici TaxID=1325689 RepID=A0AAE3IWI9_9BACI|nr:GNAT family protein [Perspicuibacillus lycopersici]MCU9614898.1 GNAT family N-acetyltransferase [Perspicuibacillus lycopersici]